MPEKVVNALNDFTTRRFEIGDKVFQLDKSGMKHILERHHPDYWAGETKATQSFFDRKMSIHDIRNVAADLMSQPQNREIIQKMNAYEAKQLHGKVNGVDYVMGLNKGRVGQLFPE